MSVATLLDVYVVYKDPEDHPGKWVVRHWQVVPGAHQPIACEVTIGESYDDVIHVVPQGFICTIPMDDDVKSIHEVWI